MLAGAVPAWQPNSSLAFKDFAGRTVITCNHEKDRSYLAIVTYRKDGSEPIVGYWAKDKGWWANSAREKCEVMQVEAN